MANYSGLFDGFYGAPYVALFNTNEENNNQNMLMAKHFRSKGQRILARLMFALAGTAAGATATESLAQLTAASGLGDPLSQGGKRTVAPVTLVNRVTTAADITLIKALLTQTFGPAVPGGYPADKAGAGGGSKISAASGTYGF